MPGTNLNDLLSVAIEAAYLGGRRTLAYFNTGVAVERKSDATPVTCADRECEQLIRQTIGRYYPDHSLVGEEWGSTPGNPDYKWIIDPIDGTKTFIHGVPLYGLLIGVEVQGVASVGVIYMPALDEMVCAAKGLGCRWNGRPARVSSQASLQEAAVMSSSIVSAYNRSDAFANLAAKTLLQRTWGDCYGYLLVATGRAEAMVDAALNLWDCAAIKPIIEEAGGRFTNWKGEATIYANDGVATNGLLHEPVLEILRAEKRPA
jgi:histidinol phosphatase-like enzyme (inositol monophosphatase family)